MGVEPGFSNLGCFWVCVLGAAGKRRAGSGGGGMCNFWRVEFVVVTFVDQYLLLLLVVLLDFLASVMPIGAALHPVTTSCTGVRFAFQICLVPLFYFTSRL